MAGHEEAQLLCHRCGKTLTPGDEDHPWYIVRIEAFADPTPPRISSEDLDPGKDLYEAIAETVEQLADSSERELMDQVHRRVTLHLCSSCYHYWIENPAGDVK